MPTTDEIKEIDKQIAQCEEVMAERSEEEMRFYQPHDKQLEYHQLTTSKRALIGGSQTGKSYAGNNDDIWTLGGVHPYRKNYKPGHRGRLIAVDERVLLSVLIPQIGRMIISKPCKLDWLTAEDEQAVWPGLLGGDWDKAFNRQAMTLTLGNGSMMDFKTHQQAVMSHAAVALHWIRFDEEPPENIYRESQARQLTTSVDERHTLTMLMHSNWLYNELYMRAAEDSDIGVVVQTAHDNPYINPEVIEQIKSSDMTESEKAARLYGIPVVLSGRIWKNYGQHNFVDPIKLPSRLTRILSIDPHRDNADFANLMAWDDHHRTLYIYAELKADGDIENRLTKVRQFCSGEHVDEIVIDPSSKQGMKSISKKTILDFYEQAFSGIIEADNARNAKDHGRAVIDRLAKRQPDGQTRLYVFKACPRTHQQFLSYSYKPPTRTGEDRRIPAIVKREDHQCDCAIQGVQLVDAEAYGHKPLEQIHVGTYL